MSESVKKPTRAEEIEAVSKELAKRNLALKESTERLAEFNARFKDESWHPPTKKAWRNGLRLLK